MSKVEQLIYDFVDKYPDAPFTFGHIVIDDYNLADGHIKYCLRDDVINKWFEYTLSMCDPECSDKDATENWKRYQYDEVVELRDAVKGFLDMLLTIPESDRLKEFPNLI